MDKDYDKYEYFMGDTQPRQEGDEWWNRYYEEWHATDLGTTKGLDGNTYRRLKVWAPEQGETVYVGTGRDHLKKKSHRIYLFSHMDHHYCVSSDWEARYVKGCTLHGAAIIEWSYVWQIHKEDAEVAEAIKLVEQAEASLAEAKQKLEQKQKRG